MFRAPPMPEKLSENGNPEQMDEDGNENDVEGGKEDGEQEQMGQGQTQTDILSFSAMREAEHEQPTSVRFHNELVRFLNLVQLDEAEIRSRREWF